MIRILNPTPRPRNLPQLPTSSDSQRGFAPASSAEQGINIQFTPVGQVTPSGTVDGGGGKAGVK